MLKPTLPTVITGTEHPGVRYFSTTRQGGVSTGPWGSFNLGLHTEDNSSAVHENRQRLQSLLPAAPVWLNQVHGTTVYDADQALVQVPAPPGFFPTADAVVTSQVNQPLAIMTADCLPVVICNAEGTVLGVAHAGWRGLAAGILEATLFALQRKLKATTQWRAWIGPAISQPYFEVGDDVYLAFTRQDPKAVLYFYQGVQASKWQADLPGLAQHRLQCAGIDKVERSNLCTYSQPDTFYSYRRASVTGRLATLAWLTPR